MWLVSLDHDPLLFGQQKRGTILTTKIVSGRCLVRSFFSDDNHWAAFLEGGRAARVALADFLARYIGTARLFHDKGCQPYSFGWELLSDSLVTSARTGRRHARYHRKSSLVPYMLERSDIWCNQDTLFLQLRMFAYTDDATKIVVSENDMRSATEEMLHHSIHFSDPQNMSDLMNHVATAVLQERLRAQLASLNAVAFVANEAILPRKSGASSAPMASPPAVPFQAPAGSPMNQSLEVSMGKLRPFLTLLPAGTTTLIKNHHLPKADAVSLAGLLVPLGVSLVVGGGYHGKSTLLRTIAAGIYNKVPRDGREFCVTVSDAVTVRAEDGRYVNNANVSAFIANLPTPPGVTKAVDTTHFSTGEASGSTSQAANVVDAIEMKCSAFLVDEDVSAANFMARDGRMRALVMDESITPLLYRVNGLFHAHGISSIVVVGGVGDWLDVPHSVILMDRYLCRDATAKANSVSRQFSHGHVQYGGRGVVHRLEWDKSGTPIPRRPTAEFASRFPLDRTTISLLDGSNALALYHHTENADDDMDDKDDDNDDHFVDMSRCEQLMGQKSQLYGCGLCLVWVLDASRKFPHLGLADLLAKLDEALDESGLAALVPKDAFLSPGEGMIEKLGFAYRPRRFEVGQALTRLRGIELEEIEMEDDGSDLAAAAEAERKKQELLEMWNARRKKQSG